MTEQERGEHDFFPQNDHQRALEWSRLNRRPDDKGQVEELLAMGRYVVAYEGPDYCPITDAIMGSRVVIAGDFASYDEAMDFLTKEHEELGDDDEVTSRIYQPSSRQTTPEQVINDSDIPF